LQIVTVANYVANGEDYESELIRINGASITSGTWPTSGSENLTISDDGGTSTVVMRIDSDMDIIGNPALLAAPPFDVQGIAGQYNDYQILPRYYTDLIQYQPQVVNVPTDYSTIQAALTAANATDTVLVQPGTYTENIIWPETNGIKLISAGDSSNTIIDGGGNTSVITIDLSSTTIDSNTIIDGFKITNGFASTKGGGIQLDSVSNMLIKNTLVENNSSSFYGGGMSCFYSSPN
ncbi:uncharacterized protein METZ01_LOCUS498645, partial [marine metagenome]